MNPEEIKNELKSLGGHPKFAEVAVELTKLHAVKSEDYDLGEPFSSLREGEEAGLSAEETAVHLMSVKWSRIKTLIGNSEEPNFESLEEAVKDLAVYTIIFYVLLHHEGRTL